MRRVLTILLSMCFVLEAQSQRSVTATVQNFNRTGTDFSFEIWARSTGSPVVNLGWSSFFFYFNSSALTSPTLTYINPKFTGDSATADYGPMSVRIVNSVPPRLGIQVLFSGHGAGSGQTLSTAAPFGERICTVRLLLNNATTNSDLRWDAGSSNENTWLLSKDTAAVSNTINGVGSVTSDITMANGWNMISVPVMTVDMASSSVYPGAATPAYGFNSGYVVADSLVNGRGYWMKFNAADTFAVFGAKVSPQTISVNAGWNMVGPLDFGVLASAITSTPTGILQTPFYGFSNGYAPKDTLGRGKGYWVKTSQAGTLNFTNAAAKAPPPQNSILANWVRIEVEDSKGMKGTLYLAKPDEFNGSYELPPVAPSGIFDVRYMSNTVAEPLNGGAHRIQFNSASYPIMISAANLDGMTLRVKDLISGELIDTVLREGGEVSIPLNLSHVELLEQGTANKVGPTAYELNQNYPNPFNPTTIIKFGVPKDSHVSVTVYNVLGQEVVNLVDRDYETGYHQVEFNAANLATGMYVYRMETAGFVQIRKMLILK